MTGPGRRALLLVVAGLLAAAGCSGTPGPAAGGGAASSPSVPASSASPETAGSITVTSSAFADGAQIPSAHTCHGAGTPPPLGWSGIPSSASSIAVTVTDPDAPGGNFVHWALLGIPVTVDRLTGVTPPAGATALPNSAGGTGWTPPCPPSGTHHYLFTVYALDRPAPAAGGAGTPEIIGTLAAQSVASGRLTGIVTAG